MTPALGATFTHAWVVNVGYAEIETRGLVKRFDQVTALNAVDVVAQAGTVLGVVGPNGSGKTTLIRILATLLRPDAGSARVGGHDVVREAPQVRRLISLAGQYAAIDNDLTGYENLLLVARLLGLTRRGARRQAHEMLEKCGLSAVAQRPASTYSGGMRRRLDLAISLVGAPRVLFLDEPTTGLDPRSRADLWALVRKLADNGSTVLLTTQYLDEADRLADEIVVMNHGQVAAAGTPSALKSAAGGRTLNLTPIDPNDLSATTEVVASLTGAIPNVDVPACQVTVLLTDPGVAPAVLRRLDEAGIMVAELSVHMPSLNDVFLALTSPCHGASTPSGKVIA